MKVKVQGAETTARHLLALTEKQLAALLKGGDFMEVKSERAKSIEVTMEVLARCWGHRQTDDAAFRGSLTPIPCSLSGSP